LKPNAYQVIKQPQLAIRRNFHKSCIFYYSVCGKGKENTLLLKKLKIKSILLDVVSKNRLSF